MEKDLYMDKELTSALYRDANQWQLERERKAVAERLRKVVPSELHGSHEMLSAICKAISEPVMGWTVGAGELLRDRLIELLGAQDTRNATNFAGNQQNGPKLGEKQPEMQKDVPKSRDSLQEVEQSSIADERHKAVCELRKMRLDTGTAIKKLAVALGIRWNAANVPKSCAMIQSRLIHLLGGDECNFSGAESDIGMQDDGTNPAEASNSHSDSVSFGIPSSITSELRKFAETFRYEWYDVKDGSSCYTTSDCPPSLDSVNMTDYINGIADRIEEQFARCCKLWERTATDTAQEVHDSMEAECNELARDVEMWRDRAEDMRMERDDLRAELRVANQTHECNSKLAERNEQWCDALVDLIRDAAEDYQECQRLLRVFKCHVKDVRHERDELLDKLQAISVLCEQDDG